MEINKAVISRTEKHERTSSQRQIWLVGQLASEGASTQWWLRPVSRCGRRLRHVGVHRSGAAATVPTFATRW